MPSTNLNRRTIDQVLTSLGLIATIALLALGGLVV